jgi:hypothetical protein
LSSWRRPPSPSQIARRVRHEAISSRSKSTHGSRSKSRPDGATPART